MQKIISPEYAALNKHLHAEMPHYGATAGSNTEFVISPARANGYKTILDFGCGKGTLKTVCAGQAPDLTILEYDPAIEGKDSLPEPGSVDYVVALDVMEHIEPDYLEAVLGTIRDLRPKEVLLVISLKPATKSLPDGRNAHLIVKPAKWWTNRLRKHFKTTKTEESPHHLLYSGKPL